MGFWSDFFNVITLGMAGGVPKAPTDLREVTDGQ